MAAATIPAAATRFGKGNATAVGGEIAQFLPDGLLQRRWIEQADGRICVERLVGQLVKVHHVAVEGGLATFAKHGRRQGLGEKQGVA